MRVVRLWQRWLRNINCTKQEQRSVIRFLWAEGVPGEQTHLRMCVQYGDKVLSRRIVCEWIEMFESGARV